MKLRALKFLLLHLIFWGFNFTRALRDFEPLYYIVLQHVGMLIVFYFNYFILVPKIVKKNKPAYYFLWILALFGIFWVVKVLDYFTLPQIDHPGYEGHSALFAFGAVAYFSFYYGGISTVLRLGYDLFEIGDQNKVLQMQKTNTQIQFMKSNINIPFIVQALSHLEGIAKEDPENIKEPLLQLSSLLRYGTYDATLDKIELEKELGILQEFIGLINEIETRYQLKLNFKNIDYQIQTVPNLLIKIISYWRDQVNEVLSGEIVIEISCTLKRIEMYLPVAGVFTLDNLNSNYPEINNHFFNTHYSLHNNFVIVDINPSK